MVPSYSLNPRGFTLGLPLHALSLAASPVARSRGSLATARSLTSVSRIAVCRYAPRSAVKSAYGRARTRGAHANHSSAGRPSSSPRSSPLPRDKRAPTRGVVGLFDAFLGAHAIHFSMSIPAGLLRDGWREHPCARWVFSDDRGGFAIRRRRGGGNPQLRASHLTRGLRLAGGLGIGFIWLHFITGLRESHTRLANISRSPRFFLIAGFVAFLMTSRRNTTGSP